MPGFLNNLLDVVSTSNVFLGRSTHPRDVPKALSDAKREVETLSRMFPDQPWVSDELRERLEKLKAMIADCYEAYERGDTKEMPWGLDYSWLEDLVKSLCGDVEYAITSYKRDLQDNTLVNFITASGQTRVLKTLSVCASGGWSHVYHARVLQDGTQVAFKELAPRSLTNMDHAEKLARMNERLAREKDVWLTLKHPNLVPLLGYCETPRVGLVSPYFDRRSLDLYFEKNHGNTSTSFRLGVVLGCAKGLAYLHQMKVIHGDIRESNVLIDDNEIAMLSDFGGTVTEEFITTNVATKSRVSDDALWHATERTVVSNQPSFESDVYSFGSLILY
ncbi:hypothetical protein FRC02_004852, partial [Tulasnella sp. 418]